MQETVRVDCIEIDRLLHEFVDREVIPGTGIDGGAFWRGFAALALRLAPRNAALLARRDLLQSKIDAWHRQHPGAAFDPAAYKAFLAEIGYLVAGARALFASTPPMSTRRSRRWPAPQLVVPVDNARYALNAANARWGTLYDALYGTDAIPTRTAGAARQVLQSPARRPGDRFGRDFLDAHFPLRGRQPSRCARGYRVDRMRLIVELASRPAALAACRARFVRLSGRRRLPRRWCC